MDEILRALDVEITKLQKVRTMLTEGPDAMAGLTAITAHRGRPKGSVNKLATNTKKPGKRVLSAEGKARIALAQKTRWAAQKTDATKKDGGVRKLVAAAKKPNAAIKKSVASAKESTTVEASQ